MLNQHSSKKVIAILCGLLCLFMVPLGLAWWMVAQSFHFSSHTTNLGTLINPPIDFTQLQPMDNKKSWYGQWFLLYINPNRVCDLQCEAVLHNLHQIHTAMGKDADRVKLGILFFNDNDTTIPNQPTFQPILKNIFSDILVLITSHAHLAQLIQSQAIAPDRLLARRIYIIDPLGNMMLFYSIHTNPMAIFKDLTHLLKISHIG